MIATNQLLSDRLVAWAESLTSEEREQARIALSKWCEEHGRGLDRRLTPRKMAGESMKHDLDTLMLNDYDRAFLQDLKIEIPEDARWEIDGDGATSSAPEAAE